MKWVEDSKALVDAGETGTHTLWSDDWSKGFWKDGDVLCPVTRKVPLVMTDFGAQQ